MTRSTNARVAASRWVTGLIVAREARPDLARDCGSRGRMIPVSLAWLGVFASALLVLLLPLQLAGLASGVMTSLAVTWLPMLVFEVVLAVWLLVKGVAAPIQRHV